MFVYSLDDSFRMGFQTRPEALALLAELDRATSADTFPLLAELLAELRRQGFARAPGEPRPRR